MVADSNFPVASLATHPIRKVDLYTSVCIKFCPLTDDFDIIRDLHDNLPH